MGELVLLKGAQFSKGTVEVMHVYSSLLICYMLKHFIYELDSLRMDAVLS